MGSNDMNWTEQIDFEFVSLTEDEIYSLKQDCDIFAMLLAVQFAYIIIEAEEDIKWLNKPDEMSTQEFLLACCIRARYDYVLQLVGGSMDELDTDMARYIGLEATAVIADFNEFNDYHKPPMSPFLQNLTSIAILCVQFANKTLMLTEKNFLEYREANIAQEIRHDEALQYWMNLEKIISKTIFKETEAIIHNHRK